MAYFYPGGGGGSNVSATTTAAAIRKPYNYIVYKDSADSTYKAMNSSTGVVDYSNAALDPVITSILAAFNLLGAGVYGHTSGGSIYIQAGDHILSGAFAGWDIPPYTRITCAPNCFINVPSGYTGYVFGIAGTTGGAGTNSASEIVLEGFFLRENGTNQHLWDGVLFNSNTNFGIYNCLIQELVIQGASTAIHLKVGATSGWINGNTFRHISISNCVNGIWFDANGFTITAANGCNRNMFENIEGQAGSNTFKGYKDIHGINNYFMDCKMWDINTGLSGAATANIVSGATGTHLIGGIMTSQNFTDAGTNTWIDDDNIGFKVPSLNNVGTLNVSGLATFGASIYMPGGDIRVSGLSDTVAGFTQRASGANLSVYLTPGAGSAPSCAMSLWRNGSQDQRFYFLADANTNTFASLRQTSGSSSAVPPMIFQSYDVPASVILEGLRIDGSGNTITNMSGGSLKMSAGATISGTLNIQGTIATTSTLTAAKSGTFAPLNWLQIQVSGSNVKIPYFAV